MQKTDFITALTEIYLPFFEADYILENLDIPDIFFNSIGKLRTPELYGHSSILSATKSSLTVYDDDFLERKAANTPTEQDKLYLWIGEWGSRHEFLLCCDKSSSQFGMVLDFNDAHPWCEGNEAEVDWNTFQDFLFDEYEIQLSVE